MTPLFKKCLNLIATALAATVLVACGGGGGGGSATDTTPDAFAFSDLTNQALTTQVESNAITVAGINAAAAITISGGEYQINGGSWASVAGTVTSGQTVKVRHTTSASYSTATNTILTIGGVTDTFTTTTVAEPTLSITTSGDILSGANTDTVVADNSETTSVVFNLSINTPYTLSISSVTITPKQAGIVVTENVNILFGGKVVQTKTLTVTWD